MTVEADLLVRPPRRRQVPGHLYSGGPELLRIASARDGVVHAFC